MSSNSTKRRGNPNWAKGGPSPNPTGARTDGTHPRGSAAKLPADDVMRRLDAWVGRATGIGMPGVDKGVDVNFVAEPVGDHEAAEMWGGDDVCKRVVELPVEEMYREGYEFKTDDQDVTKAVTDFLESLGGDHALMRAKMYERAYGGAAIFPVMQDGQKDLSRPLNENRISNFTALHVLEPAELDVVDWYTDITDKHYRKPMTYRLNPIAPGGALAMSSTVIHESRLIIWPGVHTTYRVTNGLRPGWGHNVFTLMKSALRGFNLAHSSISTLLVDFAQATIKIKNLANLLASGKIDEIQARMRLVEIGRSIAQAVLLDADEEYKRETTNVSGLADMVDRVVMRLAAAAGMPVTLMMGQSPKGLGNEGDSDLAWWDKQIGGNQKRDTPRVKRLHDLTMLAKDGPTGGVLVDYTFTWQPLDQPSEAESAQSRLVQAQTDEKYFGIGVLSADDIAESRFGGEDGYSYDTKIDWKARAQAQVEAAMAEEEQAQQADELHQAQVEATANPSPPDDGTDPNDDGEDPNDEGGDDGGDEPPPDDKTDADWNEEMHPRGEGGKFGDGGGGAKAAAHGLNHAPGGDTHVPGTTQAQRRNNGNQRVTGPRVNPDPSSGHGFAAKGVAHVPSPSTGHGYSAHAAPAAPAAPATSAAHLAAQQHAAHASSEQGRAEHVQRQISANIARQAAARGLVSSQAHLSPQQQHEAAKARTAAQHYNATRGGRQPAPAAAAAPAPAAPVAPNAPAQQLKAGTPATQTPATPAKSAGPKPASKGRAPQGLLAKAASALGFKSKTSKRAARARKAKAALAAARKSKAA